MSAYVNVGECTIEESETEDVDPAWDSVQAQRWVLS